MEYKKDLVSVIIPTYKRCDMLIRAIDSVLNQTYLNIELIVVNDNEKNDEWSKCLYERISTIKDERFVFIEQDKHINGAVARNKGIAYASGEYIAFLDDDDYWELNKIEAQVNELSKLDSSWGGVSCLKKFYHNGKFKRATLPYKSGYIFYDVVTNLVNITTGTILIRHSALDNAGYFDESLMRSQDIQLFSYLTKKYKIKLLKKHFLNSDISDSQNRPSAEKSLLIEKSFVNSISPLLMGEKKRIVKKINCSIFFNIGVAFIREKHFFKGLFLIIKSLACPSIFFKKIYLYLKGTNEIVFKKMILKHYAK